MCCCPCCLHHNLEALNPFPFSRCKTTSTLNGVGEVCAPWMLLLLPYQDKWQGAAGALVEYIINESYQSWVISFVFFPLFVCLFSSTSLLLF